MPLTKLICTLGPASVGRVTDLAEAGMDVARVNFSHGTDADRARAFDEARQAGRRTGRPVSVLADLRGPKIRLGDVMGERLELTTGARFVLRPPGSPPDASGSPVSYERLAGDLRVGDRVLLADGAVELVVEGRREDDVITTVLQGGSVRRRSGVNVPSERLSLPAIGEGDRADAARAIELGADFLAQSFVRSAEDVEAMRRLIGDRPVGLVAKVETRAAVEDADRIIAEADAVMIARGDLGVEIAYEQVPLVQKDLVSRCVRARVPVIVATQMLESMTASPRPTRAEVSDVANTVLESVDAILLSAETAVGQYPVQAARAAALIAAAAERGSGAWPSLYLEDPWEQAAVDETDRRASLAFAAAELARKDRGVAAIACFTRTGHTPALLSAGRPQVPVIAFAPDEGVVRRLTIRRGVEGILTEMPADTDALLAMMDRHLREHGLVPKGALVVMAAPTPVGTSHTNFLKLHRIGT